MPVWFYYFIGHICLEIENEIQHFIPQDCRFIVQCVTAILLNRGDYGPQSEEDLWSRDFEIGRDPLEMLPLSYPYVTFVNCVDVSQTLFTIRSICFV